MDDVCNLLIAQNGFNIYYFFNRLAAVIQNGPLDIAFCATTRFKGEIVFFFLINVIVKNALQLERISSRVKRLQLTA